MIRKAAIISIKGTSLSSLEMRLLKKEKPWGVILFKRNIISLNCNKLKNIPEYFLRNNKYKYITNEQIKIIVVGKIVSLLIR